MFRPMDPCRQFVRTLRWCLVLALVACPTWPVRAGMFGVPIDNIWTRAPLLIEQVAALPDAMGSNHRGLTASLSIAGGQ